MGHNVLGAMPVRDFSKKIPPISVGPARTAPTWLYKVLADTMLVERPNTDRFHFSINITISKLLGINKNSPILVIIIGWM